MSPRKDCVRRADTISGTRVGLGAINRSCPICALIPDEAGIIEEEEVTADRRPTMHQHRKCPVLWRKSLCALHGVVM
jgi:hypothetical protein